MASVVRFSEICLFPLLIKERGRDVFEVHQDIIVTINETPMTIPKGFKTDGASIPRWARWKFSSWGKYSGPSILHDYLLKETDKPKWLCDVLFYIALRCAGVSSLESALFWCIVRLKRVKD